METDKNYLMVGSFVLLTILTAIIFAFWLVGVHDNSKYTTYRIHFAESVSGLDVGGPVKFRGVQVGKVEAMAIDPDDARLIRVDVSILKTTPVKADTVAILQFQGITGGVYIQLSGGNQEASNLALNDEGNPPEIPSQPSTISTLMDLLPKIAEKMSHITSQVDKLLSDKNIASLSDTVGNAQKASRDAAELTRELKENPTKLIFAPKEKEPQSDDSYPSLAHTHQ